MTGSFPQDQENDDTFVATTGVFEGYKGNIRLSGAVVPGDPFYFNCVWMFNVQAPGPETSAAYTGVFAVSVFVTGTGLLSFLIL